MDQVVAIGEGRSNLPMFAAAGFGRALPFTGGGSFLDALCAVPGLLDD